MRVGGGSPVELITHAHLFCGDGGGADGFQRGHVRVGTVTARFECLGGIDVDPVACADFRRFVGVPATCLDLFDAQQYRDFHGKPPPAGWREVVPADIRRAFGDRRPDIGFTSAPCPGFSGLLSEERSVSPKYQALNRLTVRGISLFVQAYADDPAPLILFENVPRIRTRGRALLADIRHELEMAGYAVAETEHDCGEIGGLGQHRRRFLLVARHRERVRPFVYVPPKRRVRGVGEIIGDLPLPGEVAGGAMHKLPELTWKTWLRLALIPAGKDWRALRDVDFGSLRLVPRNHGGGPWGVVPWTSPVGTITAEGRPQNGPFAVADVRIDSDYTYSVYRVVRWTEPSKTVSGDGGVGSGGYTVADVRIDETRHNNVLRVVEWQDPTQAVTAGAGPTSGGQAVGDVRFTFKAADAAFASGGHYGVLPWSEASGAVTSSAQHDNGRWSVADPRAPDLMPLDARPDPAPRILSLDDSWHRPLTTLEMAVLQGYNPEDLMLSPLGGGSHTSWREHIGNRVPPPAAQAMAEVMAEALILHRIGGSFTLDARPVWVRRLLAVVDSAVTP